MKTMREKIEFLINETRIPVYQIAKESGLKISPVQRIRTGEAKVDNIRLETAEILAAYYDEKKDDWILAGYLTEGGERNV